MKITRTMTIETNEIQIGDRIQVGHYTATCQKLPEEGLALFFLDQYLDKAMQMNKKSTNAGGYDASDLRKVLNSGKILDEFATLELVPFKNGDLLRLPFYGELFGHDDWYESSDVEPDDCEQWPLMKERANRVAERKGRSYEWGWLQNIRQGSATLFCSVSHYGTASDWPASNAIGVRPVFLIKRSATYFCRVNSYGPAYDWDASISIGGRPVFLI